MKLHKSSTYLEDNDLVRDQIYDLTNSNLITLQDLAEASFLKSYDAEQTAQLRKEITFENIVCNLIEFDVYNKSSENDLKRLSKSASVLNYNLYLNSRNSTEFQTPFERSCSELSSTDLTTKSKIITSSINDFYLSTKFLNNLEKYTKKKKSKLAFKKNQMKKMNRLETDSEFYLAPLDHEYKDYVRQKKQLRNKLHDHWKIELNSHQKDKILKINNNVFNAEDQWMTICNNKSSFDDRDPENNLIDTFTANIENPNNEKMDSYKVNSEVGTLIAQKLLKGEKIRVGRNGSVIGVDSLERGHSIAKLFETFKIPSNGSILSWNDQVNKDDIKIIEPKMAANDIQKKPKPERNLIVKKLNEEEEFRPVIKKQNTILSPIGSAAQSAKLTRNDKNSNSTTTTTTITNLNTQLKPAVEIVGTNTMGHPFQQHLKTQKPDSSQVKHSTSTNNTNKNNDWSLDLTVVKQHINTLSVNNNKATNVKGAINNLTEKNYLQIVDNLTSRYTSTLERTKSSNETTTPNTKKVINNNKFNKKDHKDKVLEFINDLGLKSTELKRRKGTSSASFKSQSSNNLNLKAYENNHKLLAPINNNNKVDNTKTNESNNTSNTNNDNINRNSQQSNSPRTYSSFSQANTFKVNSSEKSIKNTSTGQNNFSNLSSSSSIKNLTKPTLRRRNRLLRATESSYFNIVKPIEPKIRPSDITSSFKQIILDINKSDSNYLAPISPTGSLLTR